LRDDGSLFVCATLDELLHQVVAEGVCHQLHGVFVNLCVIIIRRNLGLIRRKKEEDMCEDEKHRLENQRTKMKKCSETRREKTVSIKQ